jgi:putative hemolysin
MDWDLALIIALCLALSFLFSGMEAGVLAVSRLRIRQLKRAGDLRAKILLGYLDKPENFLWTILVGNILANFIAVGLLVYELREWAGGRRWLLLPGLLAVMFVMYTFCELLPKMLFRMLPNRLSLRVAGPFRFVHIILSPLVSLVTALARGLLHWTGGRTFTGSLFASREEMRLVMQESAQGLSSDERVMINRVLDLQNIPVSQIATPIDRVASVQTDTPMNQALQVSRDNRFSRLPVWRQEGAKRRVAGLLNLRAVLYQTDIDPAKTAKDYITPALYLDEDMRLEAALKRMQRGGQRLASVLGRNQQEIGVVSLQDILKVIFGEVRL